MYCSRCGAEIDDDSLYCSHCGAPVAKEKMSPMNPHRQTPGSIEPIGTTGNMMSTTGEPAKIKKTNIGSVVGFIISMVGVVLIILAMIFESVGLLIATAVIGGVGTIISSISLAKQDKIFRARNSYAGVGITLGVILFVAGLLYAILL
ncbi:MAG: zinc ribbon domain-containing protein [Coprobacillus sp.]|nr:zinc ribbon domain-containing protein [Coprobacillus sp.]